MGRIMSIPFVLRKMGRPTFKLSHPLPGAASSYTTGNHYKVLNNWVSGTSSKRRVLRKRCD